jgi:hypothetical protein
MSIEDSFARLTLNAYDVDRVTRYECSCGEKISLNFEDFRKHWKSTFTNLDEGDFVGAPEGRSFLDFYCPSCKAATTIIYDLEAGGQHGEHWYNIRDFRVSPAT